MDKKYEKTPYIIGLERDKNEYIINDNIKIIDPNTIQGISSDNVRFDVPHNDDNSLNNLSDDDKKIINDILARYKNGFDMSELFVKGELDELSIKGVDYLSHVKKGSKNK